MDKKILTIGILVIILLAILIYFITSSSSEIKESEIIWSKTFGGNNNEDGYYVLSTDNGCIAVGYTESYEGNSADIYVVKIDGNGDIEWEKNYGGSGDDFGKSIIEVSDGYIIVGSSNSEGITNSDYNAIVIKIDKSGSILWNKTYGNAFEDYAYSILETKTGTYLLTGSTYSFANKDLDLWVLEINEVGNETMSRSFGENGRDEGRSIVQTDDGFIIAGEVESYSKSQDYSDAWILKINKTGKHIWNKTFDGFGYNDLFNQIIETDDGFIAVGHARNKTSDDSYDEYSTGYIVLIDKNGETIVERLLEEDQETGISSVTKADDGYIVTGYIGQYGAGDGNITVERINENLERVWLKEYGGEYSDSGVWIDRGTDNYYFVTGYQEVLQGINKDLWVAKLNLE